MTLRITEVYFRSLPKKSGQQWFEVHNNGSEPVNLRKASVTRLDKQEEEQAWEVFLPDEDLILEPDQYAVIAQNKDLGQNLCSEHQVIVLSDSKFAFKASLMQKLCIKVLDEPQVCVKISNSQKTEDGKSRIPFPADKKKPWVNELCELRHGFFASPGLPMLFCQKNIEAGWTTCPEPVVEVKAVERQSARHAGGCQTVAAQGNLGFELLLLLGMTVLFCVRSLTGRG